MSNITPSKIGHTKTEHLRSIDIKKTKLAPLWPEWNDADVNAESWDVGKKKETAVKARTDTKSASSSGTHGFEDPEGKIELPPSLKVEHWKRPVDVMGEKTPVIVEPDLGMQNFDLVTPNEHLHYSETMRNIISQITALWDICRKERKSVTPDSGEMNPAFLSGRTWRPWEHIYAINKVSKQPFVTPYNPAGKYVVRLFFLGCWRKIIVDDTIPFDSKNRPLLPQTSLGYELWPMLLSKALLKIVVLDYNHTTGFPEYNETSIIHCLSGWVPEPIPLKYSHAEKVWKFLRNDRSNKLVDGEDRKSNEQSSFQGPIPLYRWPDSKIDTAEDGILATSNDPFDRNDETMTENLTKKSDEKSAKKAGVAAGGGKDQTKSATGKESRAGGDKKTVTAAPGKDTKDKKGGRGTDDTLSEDQITPEAPKMVLFANFSHLQPSRVSSYGETADRSEKLRRYNLNDMFSNPVWLTCIRDIPLDPPPSPEFIPAWKKIRPRKPKVLPNAEPRTQQEPKPDRFIEITSPYISYPLSSALSITATPAPPASRMSRSATHSTIDVPDIVEVDEDGDIENSFLAGEQKKQLDDDGTSPSAGNIRQESLSHEVAGEVRSSFFIAYIKQSIYGTNSYFQLNDASESLIDSQKNLKPKREKSADKGGQKGQDKTRKVLGKPETKDAKQDASSIKSKSERGFYSRVNKFPPAVASSVTGADQQNITQVVPAQDNAPANSGDENTFKMDHASNSSNKKNYIAPKIWMEFDDFCSCFTSIVVFHNVRGYQYNHKYTEMKNFISQQPSLAAATKDKKKDSNLAPTQQLPVSTD
ncbi:unnamed protein product [Didymodactylos carnosus]|uniref:Calpain catalytic domain-containing protein n=1 Tax=Didymodactylos carnosus TaxID=1234261 RepID=A0A8S2DTS6_9BILA|nr:unnamed protein product [Didymodactylos carnosus]CAF3767547.1 unnamed protein product [Didymodactylos carnosus]